MEPPTPGDVTIAILSDIHHAGPAERARGEDYEFRIIANPLLRAFARAYRHLIWMRHPLDQGQQLDRFLAETGPLDYLVANGDYSCDSSFVGLSDPASFQSAQECLGKLRAKFGDRARFIIGDHELGKLTLFGGNGGMRLASWRCATQQLGLQPFWKLSIGRYLLMGVVSPLIALPTNKADVPPAGMAGLAAIARGASRRNPRRLRRAPAGATRAVVLSRPHGAAVFVARGIGAPPSAAGGTDHHRAFAHAPDIVEKPDAVGNSAHPVSGSECQPVQFGAARSASLVAVPGAALPGALRHRAAERRRLLHREN